MAALGELGLKLHDVDLGAIDAESDHNLSNHFIKTPYATGLMTGRHEHVLGRKGSGKSALFHQLETVVPNGVVVEKITPDAAVWNLLRQYQDKYNPNREAVFVTAWSYVLVLLCAQALSKADVELSEGSRHAFAPVHKFIATNFPTGAGAAATVRSFVKRVRSLNFEAFGFASSIAWDEDQSAEAAAFTIEQVMTCIEPAVREVGLVLALDQLDDAWDGGNDSQAIMIGLLRASKALNDKYGFRSPDQKHLRILTFVRSDIYDSLRFDDKDKHRPLEHPIIWSPPALEKMVNARLPVGVTINDILEGGMRGDANPFNHVVSRTFMRPREVLQFLGEAKKDSGLDSEVISGDAVRSAEERYSAWKVDDLKQEYSKSDPSLGTVMECLRQGVHRYETVGDLEDVISESAPDLLSPPDVTARTLVQKLFNYSVIGVRVGNSGSARYKSETPQLTLPTSGMVYVHPSLHKGLLIKEARKGRRQEESANPAETSGTEETENEFTCVDCFILRRPAQLDHEEARGSICVECAA